MVLRIEVKSVGLNFADIFACMGLYSATPSGAFVPGLEYAGEIIDIVVRADDSAVTSSSWSSSSSSSSSSSTSSASSSSSFSSSEGTKKRTTPIPDVPTRAKRQRKEQSATQGFSIGDRVMGVTRFGGYSTIIDASPLTVRKLPGHFSLEEGAGFLAQFMTAWYGLVELGGLKQGSTVFVHSAAGGVGLFAVWIAQQFGCRILASLGSTEKVDFLMAQTGLEREQIIVRPAAAARFEGLLVEGMRHLGVEGIDIVMDAIMGVYFEPLFRHISAQGRMVVFGAASMTPAGTRPNWFSLGWKYLTRPKLDPLDMISLNKSLMAFNLIWLWDKLDELQTMYDTMVEILTSRFHQPLPKPHVGQIFDFTHAVEALQYLQTGNSVGKVVLNVDWVKEI
ncbi:MAG: zinc-binding dehydrogenase [archaeon]|nr:zinc-binding dehydrogenase [archaeon]